MENILHQEDHGQFVFVMCSFFNTATFLFDYHINGKKLHLN